MSCFVIEVIQYEIEHNSKMLLLCIILNCKVQLAQKPKSTDHVQQRESKLFLV